MSRTLFWYLFRDLLWIFFLATFALAGIMSFGGLLRPLTRHGLDLWQVVQMVVYLMPAMMTYSIPIASLFATTIVYGRLSADNELTACRAAGISYISVALPGITMGFLVAIGSLLFLSYVVPYYSLSVQRVIYANVAKYVANEIERSHELRLVKGGTTVFAQHAYVPEKQSGDIQTVVLIAPTIVTKEKDEEEKGLSVPRTFAMAKKAVVHIREQEDDEMLFEADLEGGIMFYRQASGRPQAGIGKTTFGPIPVPSLIGENVKFMNLRRLEKLATIPERAQRVRRTLADFVAAEQADALLRSYEALLAAGKPVQLATGEETYEISAPGIKPRYAKQQLVLQSHRNGPAGIHVTRRLSDGRTDLTATAEALTLTADPQNDIDRIQTHIELTDAHVKVREDEMDKPLHPLMASVPMAPELQALRKRTASQYLSANFLPSRKAVLLRDVLVSRNDAIAEIHGRASFAVSCLVLVVLGCGMGMTFRSGDFLSAFAVCVIPALMIITLVVAGQQMATELPKNVSANSNSVLHLALILIWAGNAIVAGIAVYVLKRLQRH